MNNRVLKRILESEPDNWMIRDLLELPPEAKAWIDLVDSKPMKTIIAGSRTIDDFKTVRDAIAESGFSISEVVVGGAYGVDWWGEWWAHHYGIPVTCFLPDWDKYGKSAGHRRNREMGDYAEALIAVWDGKSRGTKGMIDYARKKKLKVFVKQV